MVIPSDVDCRSRTSCYIAMKFIQLPTTNRKFRKDLNNYQKTHTLGPRDFEHQRPSGWCKWKNNRRHTMTFPSFCPVQ